MYQNRKSLTILLDEDNISVFSWFSLGRPIFLPNLVHLDETGIHKTQWDIVVL